ncbi:MAG TPA: hypothetical protein VG457_08195 [Planctomycetota bacterium]|jgi:hypothetical protein|nr:hypothetical protein [Planctomycetota bacterium]
MKPILSTLVTLLLVCGFAAGQDIPALIERLKNQEAAEGASTELLKAGEGAIAPLRASASTSDDAAFKKRASSVADQLETRQAAAGLAAAWGDRWYSLFINNLKCGWVHLKAENRDGKLVFTDELFIQPNKDQSTTIKVGLTCQPNEYLTPVKMTMESTGGENAGQIEAKVKEDRLIVSHSGEMKAYKIQPNLVVDMALLRLVTILPRTQEYPIGMLELLKPKIKENVAVKFDKDELVDYKGEKVKARRYVVSDGESEDRFYWAGSAGILYRVQAGAIEAALSDEKSAKDLDTKD